MLTHQFCSSYLRGPRLSGLFLYTFAKRTMMPFTYAYSRPALTVDTIVFRKIDGDLQVLLIQRRNPPFEGSWAIPGGFVDIDELLVDAAARELYEETGLKQLGLKQFFTFDAIDRDPRQRTISVVFVAFMLDEQTPSAGDDASSADWFSMLDLPPLAFDHAIILQKCKENEVGFYQPDLGKTETTKIF